MLEKLKHTFALSDQGAKDMVCLLYTSYNILICKRGCVQINSAWIVQIHISHFTQIIFISGIGKFQY